VLQAVAAAIRIFALAGWQALVSLHTLILVIVLVLVVAAVVAGRAIFRARR
jgi:hypothetical protein